MCAEGERVRRRHHQDIRDGTLSPSSEIEPEIRRRSRDVPASADQRARDLERVREQRDGVLLPGDYWPNLALIGCWKGGTVGHYMEKFPAWFDPDGRRPLPVRDWGYLSSEARGSIPLSDDGQRRACSPSPATSSSSWRSTTWRPRPDDPHEVELPGRRRRRGRSRSTTSSSPPPAASTATTSTTSSSVTGRLQPDAADRLRAQGSRHDQPHRREGEREPGDRRPSRRRPRTPASSPDHFKAEADAGRQPLPLRVEFATQAPHRGPPGVPRRLRPPPHGVNIEYEAKRKSLRLGRSGPARHAGGVVRASAPAQIQGGKRAFQAKTELLSPVKAETQAIRPELERIVELGEGPPSA